MADITNKNLQIPGVNSNTNYKIERAYLLNFGTNAEVAEVGTHDLQKIPAGEAVVGFKIVSVDTVTSGGAGTVQFKLKNGTAVGNLNSSTVALASLAQGMAHSINVNGINTYGENDNVLQLTVGTANLTGGKLLIIVETLPVKSFITNG
jgi:hypothetical protein